MGEGATKCSFLQLRLSFLEYWSVNLQIWWWFLLRTMWCNKWMYCEILLPWQPWIRFLFLWNEFQLSVEIWYQIVSYWIHDGSNNVFELEVGVCVCVCVLERRRMRVRHFVVFHACQMSTIGTFRVLLNCVISRRWTLWWR